MLVVYGDDIAGDDDGGGGGSGGNKIDMTRNNNPET